MTTRLRLPIVAALTALSIACTHSSYRPASTPLEPATASLGKLWENSQSSAYASLLRAYEASGELPVEDGAYARACASHTFSRFEYAPLRSQAAELARGCGAVAANDRLRTRVLTGAVPCAELDHGCDLRRARFAVEQASGSRFSGKAPECAEFVLLFSRRLQTSDQWTTCSGFSYFEVDQVTRFPSWDLQEFRACLAPHVPNFPELTSCIDKQSRRWIDRYPYSSGRRAFTPDPARVKTKTTELMKGLESDQVRCTGLLGETTLVKADAVRGWEGWSKTFQFAVQDEAKARHGDGALDDALRAARRDIGEFRSELCLRRQ